MASASGIHLGAIINVQEATGNQPRPMPLLQAADKGAGNIPTQVTPGENTVTSTITLSYQIY